MSKDLKIIQPSPEGVKKYLKLWYSLENYTLQESSLQKLFTKTYPKNNDLDDVLIKVCSLNDLYGTNILSSFPVAKHIVNLKIDQALEKDDLTIVNKIASVRMNGGKVKNFYSFATKYCSHHKSAVYPIFDYYVEKAVSYFNDKDSFSKYTKSNLQSYPHFKGLLMDFRKFYDLEMFDLKQIDHYLWQVGKKYFPRKY